MLHDVVVLSVQMVDKLRATVAAYTQQKATTAAAAAAADSASAAATAVIETEE